MREAPQPWVSGTVHYEDEDKGRGRLGKMRVTVTGGHTPPKPTVDQNSPRADQKSFQSGPKVGCRVLPILGLPAQSGPKVPEWTTIPPDGAPRPRQPLPAQGAHQPRRERFAGRPASKTTPGVVSHGQPRVPATSGTLKRRSLTPTRPPDDIWRPGQRAEPCGPAPGSLALAGERPKKSGTRSTKSHTPSRANTASAPAVPRLLMPAPPGVSGLQVQIPFGFRGSGFGFPALLKAMRASGRPGLLSVLYHTLRHCQALTYNFFRLRNIRKCKHLRFYTRMAKSSRAK